MMRKIFFLFASLSLFATEEPQKSIWDYHPIHIGGNALFIGKGDVKIKGASNEDGHLVFNKQNGYFYTFVPINMCNFFIPRIEYNTFEMDWNENPRFNSARFHYMQFALTFFSTGLKSWRWIARADYNIDVDHFSKPKTYGLFSALLWGTHDLGKNWHYHVGAFGYTGFEGQEVYPILGLDFSPNDRWKFEVVFPITYSIQYKLTSQWTLALKGRPLKERFRAKKFEPSPKSVFNYSTIGAELNLSYEKFLNLEFEAFAGYNFGGDFYIKDQTGHQSLYTKVQGAPYVGASLNWGI